MGQAPIRVCTFFLICVVFVFLCCFHVSKCLEKNWIGGGWVGSDQFEFFSDPLASFPYLNRKMVSRRRAHDRFNPY